MSSRRLIRTKVLQLLYTQTKRETSSIEESERTLMKSVNTSYDLYYQTLLLFTEIQRYACFKIDTARNKFMATHEDLNPNTNFIDNKIFSILNSNKQILSIAKERPSIWIDQSGIVAHFFNKIINSEYYTQYMSLESPTFNEDKELVLHIFANIITQDDTYYDTLEDINIYWNDDFELVLSVVYKTLKNLKETTNDDSRILYPIFKADDIDFAKKLMRKTLLDQKENIELIDKYANNWDIDRMVDIDKVIMSEAISEIKYFESIPVKVSLDEYIELAKSYSSLNSSCFINGVLDKIIGDLKANGQIIKTGRGLIE